MRRHLLQLALAKEKTMGRKDIDRLASRMDAMEERVLQLQRRELLCINKIHESVDTMGDTVDKLNHSISAKDREISRLKQAIKYYNVIEFDTEVVSDYGLRPPSAPYIPPNNVQRLPPYYNPVKLTTCGCLCELCSKCKK